MTGNEFTYWAFISHSAQDNCKIRPNARDEEHLCWGDWLHEALKTFSIPAEFTGQINARGEIVPERIAPVFFDPAEPSADASLSEHVRHALEQSKCLIVICSPRSAQSRQVNEHVRYFRQLGRGNRILPIVIAGEPNVGDGNQSPDEECFVPALRHPVKPDGTLDLARRDRGSIFADARFGADKREILAKDRQRAETELEIAKIKLIAGLIGVGFNGLWGREVKRRFSDTQIKIPEPQNLNSEAQGKILEAQLQAQEALGQVEAARNQARLSEIKFQEAQQQLETARAQVREAQNRILEIQNLPQDVKGQIQEAQAQARAAQNQLEEARSQARTAEGKFLEAQRQVAEVRDQVREAQKKIQEGESQIGAVQNQVEAAQAEARTVQKKFLAAQQQAHAAQNQVQEIQNKTQTARRLIKVFAVMAVLALLAAGIALWQRKLAIQALAKSAATDASAGALSSGSLNREQIQQSQDDWMKTNAPAAFDWSCQLTNADSRQSALEKIIPQLAADNFTNALARLNGLTPAPGQEIYTLLFQRWAAENAVQAIAQRQQLPGHDADNQILSAIMSVWADQKPADALSWLESQPDSESFPAGTWREAMIADLFTTWAAKDLEAATTACQQLPDGMAKEKAWACVLNQRMVQAPATAAEPVKNLAPGDSRQNAIAELCQHWAGTDAPAAMAWAQTLPVEAERIDATNQVIVSWARKNPPAAAQFANQHLEFSDAVFGEIANAWAQHDFSAATNWIATLPDDDKKNVTRLAVMETWSQHDPQGMANYALGLAAGDTQTRYLTAACDQLAIRDLPGTVGLLQTLSDAGLRQMILEQAAGSCDLPHLNPAAKFIAGMPAGDDQQAAIKGLLSSWLPVDPAAAVNWLHSFPETNAQPKQVQSAIETWAQSEPAAVAKWLANLPAGTTSTEMVDAFLAGAVVKHPEFVGQWIQSVADETQRQRYEVQTAQQWMKADPAAAIKWLDSLDLPEAIKHSLKAQAP